MAIENIPCQFDKRNPNTNRYLSVNEGKLINLGCNICSTLCARDYKGYGSHHGSLIIVKEYE